MHGYSPSYRLTISIATVTKDSVDPDRRNSNDPSGFSETINYMNFKELSENPLPFGPEFHRQ